MNDPHDLQRFVDAQNPVYAHVRAELAAGAKTSHWMWFVFPQLRGLGRSATAQHFGIGSLQEAKAYAAHPVLGPRLTECTGLVVGLEGRSVHQIFGSPDDMKLCSCMTLFAQAAPHEALFARAIEKYFDGQPDQATLDLLRGAPA
jgi:uncharacterized protein (DUF1810 family)